MPAQRDIKRRIVSVRNTRKITKAMEMVAAARLRRAQQRIESARPYALNMMEFIAGLVRYLQVDVGSYPLLKEHEKVRRVAVVALTADRGMCGAFNSNIVRRALDRVHAYQAQGIETDLIVAGRKGIGTLRFQGYKPLATYMDITDRSAFLDAQAIAHRVADLYVTEKVDRVHLVFNRFKSAMEQFITDQVILPIQEELVPEYTPQGAAAHMDFLYRTLAGGDPGRPYPHVSGDNDLSGAARRHGERARGANDGDAQCLGRRRRDDRRADPGDEPGAAGLHHPGDPGSGGRCRCPVRMHEWRTPKAMNKGKIVEIIGPVIDVAVPR